VNPICPGYWADVRGAVLRAKPRLSDWRATLDYDQAGLGLMETRGSPARNPVR